MSGRKIIDTIKSVHEKGGTTVSLEFFPAKTEEGVSNLLSRIEVSVCFVHNTRNSSPPLHHCQRMAPSSLPMYCPDWGAILLPTLMINRTWPIDCNRPLSLWPGVLLLRTRCVDFFYQYAVTHRRNTQETFVPSFHSRVLSQPILLHDSHCGSKSARPCRRNLGSISWCIWPATYPR